MTNNFIDALLESCDALQRRTIYNPGFMHLSYKAFDACMRAFDCKLPVNWIEFRVFLNAPVMKPGIARIYRDGHMEMRIEEGA